MQAVFNILAICGSAWFSGAMLCIGVTLGGYWRSLPPEEFLAWFAANNQLVARTVDDPQKVLFILEGRVGQFQATGTFHKNLLGAVDQNIVDGVVFQKRFQGTETRHLVVKVLVQGLTLFAVQDHAHFIKRFTGDGDDFRPQVAFCRLIQGAEVQVVEKALVKLKLDFPKALFPLSFLVRRRHLTGCARDIAAFHFHGLLLHDLS